MHIFKLEGGIDKVWSTVFIEEFFGVIFVVS